MILTAAAAFCGMQAYGATYYVATTGVDTNSGTLASPFKTIQRAVTSVSPGDTVLVRVGSYPAFSLTNINGSAVAPITFKPYNNERVIVDRYLGGGGSFRSIEFFGGSYIVIDGFEITDTDPKIDQVRSYDFVNNTQAAYDFAILNGLPSHNGIKFNPHNSVLTSHVTLQNLLVYHCAGMAILGHTDNLNILNSRIYDNGAIGAYAIYVYGDSILIRGNLCHDNAGHGIRTGSGNGEAVYYLTNSVIENNVSYNNNRPWILDQVTPPGYREGGDGIILWHGHSNIVRNNLVYGNSWNGIRVNGDSPFNNRVYNNTFYSNASWSSSYKGINVYDGEANDIRNNISFGNVYGEMYIGTGNTASNNLLSDPLFVNAAAADFRLQSGSPAIDAGTALSQVATDIAGTVRPQGTAYDIGAFEFFVASPAAPTGLTATTAASPNNYRQINLSWTDNASNETGFRIERKKGSGGTYAEIATTGANVVTYSDSTCGSGTTYYYRVRAYNGSGNSGYSAEANATTVEITTGRQGHWKLDSSSGTTATDSSGNSNTGTLTGGPTWVAGKIGNGLNFDGVDDRVNVGSGASLDNLAAMTLTAWIKADTLGEGGKGRIVDKTTTVNPDNGWLFFLDGTNQVSFSVDYTTANLKRSTAINAVSVGTWIHVVATWTGSATATNIKFYVNGVETSYGTGTDGTGSRVNDGTANLSIGTDSTTARTFDGVLDDVRVYNRVLSTTEITAIYRAGL